ncbi:MAG: hypothetical protein WC223_13300 [Bacteroidales bacterium]|jgi:hypothetical protein
MKEKLRLLKNSLSELQGLRDIYFDACNRTGDRRFVDAYYYELHKEITTRGKIFDGFNSFIKKLENKKN